MIADQSYGAHSARVKMSLIIEGVTIPIAQMGPDFLFVDSAGDHPPGQATIVLQVDEIENRWEVMLPEGIPRPQRAWPSRSADSSH